MTIQVRVENLDKARKLKVTPLNVQPVGPPMAAGPAESIGPGEHLDFWLNSGRDIRISELEP